MRRTALALVLSATLTACALLPKCEECEDAPTWSDRSRGEKVAIVAFSIVGVVALWALYDTSQNKDAICVGTNCGREGEPTPPPCLPSDPTFPRCSP